MQFGLFIPQGWKLDLAGIPPELHWEKMLGVARTAEAAGFDSVWVFDHFHTVPVPTQEPTYEAWTLMAALAAATSRIRLGQMCTCNSYRSPAYLAKVAASIDVISGGRLEFALGAGWYRHEYLAYGYDFPKPSVRIGMLGEAVEIIKAMWSQPEAHFAGRYYRISGAICRPQPLQQPHPPIWIAGGGEKLTLRLVARHADYANFGDSVEEFLTKRAILAEHCRQLGRDPDQITLSTEHEVVVRETQAEVRSVLARTDATWEHHAKGRRLLDGVKERAAIGTPQQVIERLASFRQAGSGVLILYFPDAAYDSTGIQLFAEQVMPALR